MEEISWTDRVKTKYCVEERRRGISCLQYNDGRLTGLVTSCVGTGFWSTLLNERYKGPEHDEEDISSLWMPLRKREDTGICGNKMPTRCNRGFYCRSYCLLKTFFGHHYAHHQELKSIIQWLLRVVFCAVVFSSSWSGVELRVMRPVCRMLVRQIFAYRDFI